MTKTEDLLMDIDKHISEMNGFSLARIGDGDLKLLKHIILGTTHLAKNKFNQQGIPLKKEYLKKILNIYKKSCNSANYISNFDVYNKDWPRSWSKKTKEKTLNWKDLYKQLGITNTNYISPEVSVFMFLIDLDFNLLEIIEDRQVCLITPFENTFKIVKKYIPNLHLIKIPGRYQKHYKHYETFLETVDKQSQEHEVFLVGGGVWGRGYSKRLKECGSVALDIGQVFDVWAGEKFPERINGLIKYNGDLSFRLTEKGKKYRDTI